MHRYLLLDGRGVVIGTYKRTDWMAAHAKAHDLVVDDDTIRPIWIEDLRLRLTWRFDRRGCTYTSWVRHSSHGERGVTCPLGKEKTGPMVEADKEDFTIRITRDHVGGKYMASVDEIPGVMVVGSSLYQTLMDLASPLSVLPNAPSPDRPKRS